MAFCAEKVIDLCFRYTGQQYDPLTELYSLRARYYDPTLGRFLSQDTYPYDYQNPAELNRYGYTANNPVNLVDPSGNAQAAATRPGGSEWASVAAVMTAIATSTLHLITAYPVASFLSISASLILMTIASPLPGNLGDYIDDLFRDIHQKITNFALNRLGDALKIIASVGTVACAVSIIGGTLLATVMLPDGVMVPDIPGLPDYCEPAVMRVQIQRNANENHSIALVAPGDIGVSAAQVRMGMEHLWNTKEDATWISSRDYPTIRSAIIKMSERLSVVVANGGAPSSASPNRTFMQEMIKPPSFRLDLENVRGHNLRS